MQHSGIGFSLNADLIDGDLSVLERHLGLVADSGASHVELILHGLDVVAAGHLLTPQVDRVLAILDRFALRRTLHLPYELNLLSARHHETHRRAFDAGLRFSTLAGCEAVTYHSSFVEVGEEHRETDFYRGFGPDAEQRYERLIAYDRETLAALADGPGADLVIGVENSAWSDPARMRGYGEHPATLVEHVDAIGAGNLGVTLDLGHLNMLAGREGADPAALARDAVHRVVHVHAHDNFGDSTPTPRYMSALAYGYGDLHLPVGWGSIDWPAMLAALDPYRGVWMMEIEFRLSAHFPELVADMARRFAAGGQR